MAIGFETGLGIAGGSGTKPLPGFAASATGVVVVGRAALVTIPLSGT
ncbi:MAG: hypothetical protein PVH41_07065 [Anaerolineae bacterium]|jgi:hypothetical protein